LVVYHTQSQIKAFFYRKTIDQSIDERMFTGLYERQSTLDAQQAKRHVLAKTSKCHHCAKRVLTTT
jgi:hypothetical protein